MIYQKLGERALPPYFSISVMNLEIFKNIIEDIPIKIA